MEFVPEFEKELWYPIDSLENLEDTEMYLMGDYQEIQFFVEKMDIRPYDRLYTKFSKHKFRVFKRKIVD